MHCVQSLFPRDYSPRMAFCRTILARNREYPQFINNILHTDETTFKKSGCLTLHNVHGSHAENPHLMRGDRSQYQFKVKMWTGILNGQIIGPYELPETLNGDNYFDFLRNDFQTLLEDVSLNIYREM